MDEKNVLSLFHPTSENLPMTNDLAANTDVVRRLFLECFSGGNLDVLDEIIAPDFVFEYPNLPSGKEGLKAIVQKNNESFADWQFTLHDEISQGDRVVVRWSASGTHVGSFLGETPTGKTVELKGISIYEVRDGLLQKDWVEPDNLDFLGQLGLLPPMTFAED